MKRNLCILSIIAILGFLPLLAQSAIYKVQSTNSPSQPQSRPINQNLANPELLADAQILVEAHQLASQYGIRPYWQKTPFSAGEAVPADQADDVIAHLIPCENLGRLLHPDTVEKIVDSNGFYSYGDLMFQSSTWHGMDPIFGTDQTPTSTFNAIDRARWAIEHGYLSWWSCARILKILK